MHTCIYIYDFNNPVHVVLKSIDFLIFEFYFEL